ncbi:MAG: 4Fe-4S binding protein [Thermofilaceae archaeon]
MPVGKILRDGVRFLLRRPVTVRYPFKRENTSVLEGFRGALKYDPGLCVGCMLCVKLCPSGAITTADRKVSINPSRCILCGQCVEVCPRKALRMTHEFEHVTRK